MSVLGRNTPDTEAGGLICSECNRPINGPMKAHKTKYEIYCAWCYASIEKEIVPHYVRPDIPSVGGILYIFGYLGFLIAAFILWLVTDVIFKFEDGSLGAIVSGGVVMAAWFCCLVYAFCRDWGEGLAKAQHGMREYTASHAMRNLPARDLAEIRANPVEGLNIYYDAALAGRR